MNVVIPIFGPYQKSSAALAEGSVNLGVVMVARLVDCLSGGHRADGRAVDRAQEIAAGHRLRAIAQDRDAAAVCGIDVNRMNPRRLASARPWQRRRSASGAHISGVSRLRALARPSQRHSGAGRDGLVKGAIIGACSLECLRRWACSFSPRLRDVYGFW